MRKTKEQKLAEMEENADLEAREQRKKQEKCTPVYQPPKAA